MILYLSQRKGLEKLEIQKILDIRHIALCNKCRLTQATTACRAFAHEDMTMKSAFTLDSTRTSNAEAFFCGAIRFNLWHDDEEVSIKKKRGFDNYI